MGKKKSLKHVIEYRAEPKVKSITFKGKKRNFKSLYNIQTEEEDLIELL